jgi:hypothetical protein
MIVVTATGGALGFWVGHHPYPDYQTPAFQAMLKDNAVLARI